MAFETEAALLGKLEPIRDWLELVEECLDRLSQEDRVLLEELYVCGNDGTVLELADELGMAKTTYYRRKNRALHRISELFEQKDVGRKWDDIVMGRW